MPPSRAKNATLTAAVPTLKRALRKKPRSSIGSATRRSHHRKAPSSATDAAEQSDDRAGRPAPLRGFDDRVHEDAEAGRGERGSEQIERAGLGIAALRDVADPEQQRRNRERHVDHEDGRPAEPLEQEPAGERAEPDPDCRESGPDGDRLPAFRSGEEVGDDRERGGHDQRSAHAHGRSHGDHLVGRVGDQGAEAGEAEDRHARLKRKLAPEAVAERAEDEQQAGEDEQVGVDHPLQLRGGGVELVLQGR